MTDNEEYGQALERALKNKNVVVYDLDKKGGSDGMRKSHDSLGGKVNQLENLL